MKPSTRVIILDSGLIRTIRVSENGERKVWTTLPNGQKHGLSSSYYKNGILKVLVFYQNDMRQGVCRKYHTNGVLQEISTYVDGKLHGPYFTFYRNEKPFVSANCIDDKFVGIYREIDKKGKVEDIMYYTPVYEPINNEQPDMMF
jgi:antitoxin component YwqK of YwqJK toxin-antitoxin module